MPPKKPTTTRKPVPIKTRKPMSSPSLTARVTSFLSRMITK